MKTRYWLITLTLICGLVVVLAGCSRSPRASFYVLEPTAKAGDHLPAQNAPTVRVAAITLPEMVDRPQLVVRGEGSRVNILEMHRWAEPLKRGIPRLLAENLSRLLGSNQVSTYSRSAVSEADYRIFVDVLRFEAAADSVTVDILWTIRRTAQGSQKTGRSQVNEPGGSGGYEALVSAYSRALAAASNDIARAIQAEWAVQR